MKFLNIEVLIDYEDIKIKVLDHFFDFRFTFAFLAWIFTNLVARSNLKRNIFRKN